ncbi:STM3941 family protein [Oscillospiraceae bacterium PP1C4]
MEDRVIIEQSFIKQLRLTLLGVVMLGVSLFLVVVRDSFFTFLIGIVGSVFFGMCFAFILYRLARPKNILVIDSNGFTDNSTAIAGATIYWHEVEGIFISSICKQLFICVTLKDTDKFLKKLHPAKAMLVKANMALSSAPIQISLSSTNAKYDEVISIMKNYHFAHQAK